VVSSLLLLVGIITVVPSFYVEPVRMNLNFRNIAIIMASCAGWRSSPRM
jgi:hypothetical protein